MRDWRTTTPDAFFMADRRGAHFPLLGDVISAFLQEGRADLLGPALGAWVGVPANERRNDLLYWVVSGQPGIGWAFDGTVRLRHDPASVLDYVSAVSTFLNIGITVMTDGPNAEERPLDGEPGQPNDTVAGVLQDAAREVLAVEELRQVLDAAALETAGAIVILQDIGSPAQPLLLREFGRTFPWSVSLRQPRPDRAVQRAAVILTGTDLGRLEVEAVAAVLEGGDVDVDVVADESLCAHDFLSRYTDPSYDLLWVVGHGVYHHDNPNDSHLPMPDGSRITAAHLEREVPAINRRRLLCSICATLLSLSSRADYPNSV